MNLSERLMKAAMERRAQPGADAQRIGITSIDSQDASAPEEAHSASVHLPDRTQAPVDAGRIAAMKMRLPEPTNAGASTKTSTGLPLWQRPVADVMRDGLATVTSLPITPRDDDAIDEDLDGVELAQTIPMPGVWNATSVVDVDRNEFHVPPLATSESLGLAGGSLGSDHDGHSHLGDERHRADDDVMINLDDVTIDAEIVDVNSADSLLDRWSQDVTADMHDRQERVDDLYRQMADAAQRPRITFGPIDLRDEITLPAEDEPALPRADDEHACPDCGAQANVDIHDPMRGRIHLSCDSCFKMWQVRVASTARSDEPFMRD